MSELRRSWWHEDWPTPDGFLHVRQLPSAEHYITQRLSELLSAILQCEAGDAGLRAGDAVRVTCVIINESSKLQFGLEALVKVKSKMHGKRPLRRSSALKGGFWENPSIDELATRQRIKPVRVLEDILGGWPEDELDDGFETSIEESGRLRRERGK